MTPAITGRPGEPPAVMEDLAAPHQIVLRLAPDRHDLAVSCTCLRTPRAGRSGQATIETRPVFPAAEAVTAWENWHTAQGIRVRS